MKNSKLASLRHIHSTDVNVTDSNGQTLLHIAATDPETKAVRRLLKKKANINTPDALGWTPLHLAAQSKRYETCKILLEANADIHAKTKDNNSVLSLLVKGDADNLLRTDLINLILPHDVNFSNTRGETPFIIACLFGSENTVQLLLPHVSDINVTT